MCSVWMPRAGYRSRLNSVRFWRATVSTVFIAIPLSIGPTLDAGGNALLAEIETLIAGFSPFSEQREQFSLALYGSGETLKLDGEGRVVLSEAHKSHAGITEAAVFVGLGHKFRIWEPGQFRTELTEATDKVRAFKQRLGTGTAGQKPPGARE